MGSMPDARGAGRGWEVIVYLGDIGGGEKSENRNPKAEGNPRAEIRKEQRRREGAKDEGTEGVNT